MSENPLEQLDLSSKINPDSLRDYANNIDDHRKAIVILSEKLQTDDVLLKARTLGQLGSFQRRINDLMAARDSFEQAIQLVNDHQLDPRFHTTFALRFAHTLHWLEDFENAHLVFENIILNCKTNDSLRVYLDFAYQHIGKCLFDQGEYTEALNYFEQAMELRLAKNDDSLIASTQMGITAAKNKLN